MQFDIVDADRKMQPELLESIEKEGVVLYEKYENFCIFKKYEGN